MVLEYPTKMILYIVVIMVLIGIMWTFRNNISKICLLPPCNEQECDTTTPSPKTENSLSTEIAGKYCSLCWTDKNERCSQNLLCYVVNLDSKVNPSSISLDNNVKDFCNVKCDKNTKTIFFQYDYISEKVEITC